MTTHCQIEIALPGDHWKSVATLRTNDEGSVIVAARNRARRDGCRTRVRKREHKLLPWRTLWDSQLDGPPKRPNPLLLLDRLGFVRPDGPRIGRQEW